MSYSQASTTKFVAVALGIAMVMGLAASAVPASAQSLSELQATIAALQAQLNAMSGSNTSTGSGYSFTRTLKVGSTGEDVRQLQILLNKDSATRISATGAGSPGNETTSFGSKTKMAVIKFQEKYSSEILTPNGLSSGTGLVGASTRAKLNASSVAMGGSTGNTGNTGGTTTPVPTGTGLMVSSPTQIMSGLAPQNTSRVPFTKVTLTAGNDGDVVVNSIEVERTGLAADSAFSGIVLLDENGLQIGLAKTFNSNHKANVGESTVIKSGTSRTFTIAGNMATDNSTRAGQVASLSVTKVNTSATVTGLLPILGASHTINASLTVGTVTNERGPLDPNTAQTKNVGTTGYTFSSVKVTAGSVEDVRLWSVRWNQASSAGSSDLANIVTIVNGTSYPTTVSSDGKFYTSTFAGGILIPKGENREISIKGDLVGGSGRTVAFNIEKTTDLYLTGETYRYGITPATTGTGISAGSIWYAGKTVTVDNGSIIVEKASSVSAQNIAPNLSNVPIGGFTVEVQGEPITVASLVFNIATTGSGAAPTSMVTQSIIVDQNGSVVAGPVDATFVSAGIERLTFTDTLLFPVGKNTYTVKGKLPSAFASNGTVILSTTPSTNWTTVTGQITGKTITPSSSLVTMNTMTVKSGALAISVASNPSAQTVVGGAQQFTFSNIVLDASASGEDLRLSTLPLDYNDGGSGTATSLTSCNIYDGATQLTTGSNTKNPSGFGENTFTFDVPLTVLKGTTKTLSVKCSIATSGSGGYAWGYDSSSSITATGLTSGQTVTVTESTGTGQTMSLTSAGTLAVTQDSSSPNYAYGLAGSTGQTISNLRIAGTRERIRINEIALQLPINASSSPSDVTLVTLWDGSTKVGEKVFTAGSYLASTTLGTCSGCGEFIVEQNVDKILTIKADLATQGVDSQNVGVPGAFVAINWDGDGAQGSSGGIAGTGISSGTKITASGTDTSANGIRVVRAYPTLTPVSLGTPAPLLTNGRAKLYRFKVTANGAAGSQIGVSQITFRISTSANSGVGSMINNVNVYAFRDSGFSTAVSGLSNTDGRLSAGHQPLNGMWSSASTDIRVGAYSGTASTTVEIPAGESRYFEIQGDVTLSSGTSESVSTQIQGDSKFHSDLNATPYAPTASSTYLATSTYLVGKANFIWRPFSTSTNQSITTNDYTSGYGIVGLPTSNTDIQTLSEN